MKSAVTKELDSRYLACQRRSVWNQKASNPKLIEMEMKTHKATINENASSIFSRLVENDANTRVSMKCFKSQPEINFEMRSLIFDFIMCCHVRLKLSTPTLFLCFNIIDRYCSKIIVKSSSYQLLALCSLWLASKYTDRKQNIPCLPVLQSLCCDQYTKDQFKEMELHICQNLNWTMCQGPTLDSFLDILVRSNTFQNRSYELNSLKLGSLILCQLCVFEPSISFNYSSSSIVLASSFLTKFALLSLGSNEFVSFEILKNYQNLDPKLHDLVTLIIGKLNKSDIPSSFRLKYSTSDSLHPILDCLFSYKSRWENQRLVNVTPTLLSPLIQDYSRSSIPSPSTYSSGDQLPSVQIPPTPTTNPSTPVLPKFLKQRSSELLSFKKHKKRNSSIMDVDFFDESSIQTLKKGRIGEC